MVYGPFYPTMMKKGDGPIGGMGRLDPSKKMENGPISGLAGDPKSRGKMENGPIAMDNGPRGNANY